MDLIKIAKNVKLKADVMLYVYDYSSIFNDLNMVKRLVDISCINQPCNNDLASLLSLACEYSSKTEIIEYLLKNAYDPLYVDCNGDSCIDYLSWNKNKKMYPVVKRLLNAYSQDGVRHSKKKRKLLGWDWLSIGFDFYKQHRFD